MKSLHTFVIVNGIFLLASVLVSYGDFTKNDTVSANACMNVCNADIPS
jgi:hypothetical protein